LELNIIFVIEIQMYFLLILSFEKDIFLEFKAQACIIQKSFIVSSRIKLEYGKGV